MYLTYPALSSCQGPRLAPLSPLLPTPDRFPILYFCPVRLASIFRQHGATRAFLVFIIRTVLARLSKRGFIIHTHTVLCTRSKVPRQRCYIYYTSIYTWYTDFFKPYEKSQILGDMIPGFSPHLE